MARLAPCTTFACLLAVVACGDSSPADPDPDGGRVVYDGGWLDAGEDERDGGDEAMDAGTGDAGAPDAGPLNPDSGIRDGGADAGAPPGDGGADAGSVDGGGTPSLTLTDGGSAPTRGGSGGSVFADDCPADQVVVGIEGAVSSWIGSIAARCASVEVTGAGPYAVETTAAGTTPGRGRGGTARFSARCPDDEVVVGFDGRSGTLVDQLTLRCAPIEITGSPGDYAVGVGAATAITSVGGSGGSAFPRSSCASDEVATGITGRAGDSLDAVGFACSAVGLAP